VAQQPGFGPGRLIFVVFRSHNLARTRVLARGRTALNERSARGRGRYQRNITNARDESSCPQWDFKPKYQPSRGCRHRP